MSVQLRPTLVFGLDIRDNMTYADFQDYRVRIVAFPTQPHAVG